MLVMSNTMIIIVVVVVIFFCVFPSFLFYQFLFANLNELITSEHYVSSIQISVYKNVAKELRNKPTEERIFKYCRVKRKRLS